MSFLLAHLSDAHIGPIPRPNLAELLSKRATGYANWLYKRSGQHDMGVLTRIVEDLKDQSPDHVLMTGDIVNIGLAAEIAQAREWLAVLGPPEQVSYAPGNHDAYVVDATPLIHETFAPWTAGEGGEPGFPYLRRRDGVALIGLDSGVPTGPFIASGRLGAAQLARLSDLLEETKAEELTRVVFVHHPPHVGGARILRGLDDAADFEAVIAKQGAELVLHGHNHRPSLASIAGPQGLVTPVVGVASASARPGGHYPAASYHLFDIERTEAGLCIALRAREINAAGEIVETPTTPLYQTSQGARLVR